MRRCVQCDRVLPDGSAHSRRYCSTACQSIARHRRWRSVEENAAREREQARARNAQDPQRKMNRTLRWRENNPEKAKLSARKVFLKCNWHLTLERYDEILVRQGGGCGICGLPGLGYSYAVDHDHNCCPDNNSCGRCIRGLLCQGCNRAIGFLNDDPRRARSAAAYLEAHHALA